MTSPAGDNDRGDDRGDDRDDDRDDGQAAERAAQWASTMAGFATEAGGELVVVAHADSMVEIDPITPLARQEREQLEDAQLASNATRSLGGGDRAVAEEPDELRTCFERDRDRIMHSAAFRRLAGKTQVHVNPDDHMRTRLTHAIEVAQVAVGIAHACRLNVSLTEAIALGHDCGHGPGGHASEDALSPYVSGGYNHAVWGADVALQPLNLCAETLDGIRNHSWSRPAPSTPEGEVVSWADRIAYVCHDFEDAVSAGIVAPSALPKEVRGACGESRSKQIGAFIGSIVRVASETGRVGMEPEYAAALSAFRESNYQKIYMRPASVEQAQLVIDVLRALVEYYADHPNHIPNVVESGGIVSGSDEALYASVSYVAGMTDRYAFGRAIGHLGWDADKLPIGVDTGR